VSAVAAVGPPPGWTTRTHRRYISRDRALLKRMQEACAGGEEDRAWFLCSILLRISSTHSVRAERDASQLLRQHFCARTAALLVPLQRYLQTLIPSPAAAAASASTSTSTFPSTFSSTPSTAPKTASAVLFPRTPFLRSAASALFPKSAVPAGVGSKTATRSAFPPSSTSTRFPSPSSTTSAYPDRDKVLWTETFPPTPIVGELHSSAFGGEGEQLVADADLEVPDGDGGSVSGSSLTEDSVSTPVPTPTQAPTLAPAPHPPAPRSSTRPNPRLAPFSERAFLATLQPLALPFKSAGKAKEFYARWIRTPAFGVWIARQEEVVERVLGAPGR